MASRRLVASLIAVVVFGCASTSERRIEPAPLADAAAPPVAPGADGRSAVDQAISAMTLRQKIGQRFIGWVPSGDTESAFAALERGEIGGYILYPWNYASRAEAISLTSGLRAAAARGRPSIAPFIAVDQEGGRVAAFRFPEIAAFPAARHLGSYDDPEVLRAAGYIAGVELRAMGVNMNLAPVLDLSAAPGASIIGDRSLGDNPEIVTRLGIAYMGGLSAAGIVAVPKHYPGHGVTSVDSHDRLPVVSSTLEELLARDLAPFRAAVSAGAPAVMTAHILYPAVDAAYPATLSDVFIRKLLRDTFGFDGIVMTDGLSMGALSNTVSLETTLSRCFEIGVDVLLVHARYRVDELIDTVARLVERGAVDEAEIDRSLRRILTVKEAHGLLRSPAEP